VSTFPRNTREQKKTRIAFTFTTLTSHINHHINPRTPPLTLPPSPSPSPYPPTLHLTARREHFRCWSGELPALSEIHTYTGLLITGSHSGVNDQEEWIEDLRRFLGKVVVHGGAVQLESS
jgi:hypothetical protein